MAEIKPKRATAIPKNVFKRWEIVKSKPIPNTFKIGREISFQLTNMERGLFADIEETNSGNYIISGLPRKVTETDFYAFCLGVGQILYNQSHQSGNTETNSGMSQIISRFVTDETGTKRYLGEVVFTLNELCRLAYGKPSSREKRAMKTLIGILDKTPIEMRFPNGNYKKRYLAKTMSEDFANGTLTYLLQLNPIFCESVKRNFSEFPQNVMKRLTAVTKKKTEAHFRLLFLLGRQDTGKPFVRNIDTLLAELGLTKAHKKDRERIEQQLLSLFDDMINIGIIKEAKAETSLIRRKERITKITFIFDANFCRKEKPDGKE